MIQTIQSAILLSLLFLSALSAQEYDACQGQEAYEAPNRGVAVVAAGAYVLLCKNKKK